MEFGAGDRIDGAEGLVEQHDFGRGGQCTHEPHALLLTAGELGGVAVVKIGWVEVDELKQLVHAGVDAPAVPLEDFGHAGDVLGDGHVREQSRLLDDIADAPAQLDRVDLRHILAVHQHGSRVGIVQAVDELDERGFAAAGGTEHADELTGIDRQGDAIERRCRRAREALGDIFEFNCRGHEPSFSARNVALSCRELMLDEVFRTRVGFCEVEVRRALTKPQLGKRRQGNVLRTYRNQYEKPH